VLADRGYSHRAGAASVLTTGASSSCAGTLRSFRSKTRKASRFCRGLRLRGLTRAKWQWPAWFVQAGQRHRVWLCALRKGALATERARHKTAAKARRNRSKKPDPQSLELASMFWCDFGGSRRLPRRDVLELYRCRWQIELASSGSKVARARACAPKRMRLRPKVGCRPKS